MTAKRAAREGTEELVERFLAGYSERTGQAYASDLEDFARFRGQSKVIAVAKLLAGREQAGPAVGGARIGCSRGCASHNPPRRTGVRRFVDVHLHQRLAMHPCQLDLNPTDRAHLEAIVRRPSSSQELAFRALLVLTVADGKSISGTARALGCCQRTVRKWVRRMSAGGIAGLNDAERSGRPRRISPSERHSVVGLACSRPEDAGLAGHTQWSSSLLAEALVSSGRVAAISGRTVQRILQGADLKPHRCEYWKRKTDPQFDAKMRPIVDLYLNPPADGPVWCFDEMTCIQALERCFRELPLRRPGELAKRSFEYVRHGTRCLLAALEVRTGRILGQIYPRRRREEFVAFLDRLDAEVPAGQVIHLVLDNLNIHRGPHVDEWLAHHPGRVVFHFLPFHASWLNQIELWFNTLQRRCLRRGDFPSVAGLEAVITAFIVTYNRLHAHPYRWTYSGDPLAA